MSSRLAAFSFVERITCLEPGARARGRYTVPPGIGRFPACLVAESVGQLAAWAAMATVDFRRRPLAGLAGATRFLGDVTPGQTVDLAVELESCGEDAVAYRGSASVERVPILELARCVGPMLPTADFDAPEALRADLRRLRDGEALTGRFRPVPEPDLAGVDGVPGAWLRAELRVPATAPFFADHFPRRPVLPGTLLMRAQLRLALRLAGEALGAGPATTLVPAGVHDVKLRALVPPGAAVEIRVEALATMPEAVTVGLGARIGGRPVATGRAEIVARSAQ
jgi:3-hydroxymyristoyl/3-hydroxydecanoyl-(acyl carrier protein) dehydratase